MKHIDLVQHRGSAADKSLTPEERNKLLRELKEDKHRIILILGAYGGLRVNEICQCRLEWLERTTLKEKEILRINIPAECRDARNKLKIWRPKTRKERTTYLFESNIINEVYFWFKNNPAGIKTSRQAVNKMIAKHFRPIIQRDNISPHALRATAQNYFRYERHYSTSFVQIVLGHKDIRTTEKHYNSLTKASAESYLMGVIENE